MKVNNYCPPESGITHVGPWHTVGVSTTVTRFCPEPQPDIGIHHPVPSIMIGPPRPPVIMGPVPINRTVEHHFDHHAAAHLEGHINHITQDAKYVADRTVTDAVNVAHTTGVSAGRVAKTAVAAPVHFLRSAAERVTGNGLHPAGRHHLTDHLDQSKPHDHEVDHNIRHAFCKR